MIKETATSQAGKAMALVAGLVTIFPSWFDRFDTPFEKILLTLVTSLGYYTIFHLSRKALLWFHNRKLLGIWYYRTRKHDDVAFNDPNVALMEFTQSGSDIEYRAALFPDANALEAAVAGSKRSSVKTGQRGSAYSRALEYDRKRGTVDLLFDVKYTTGRIEDRRRTGHLMLEFQEDGTLHGEYVSQVDIYGDGKAARALSSGVMYATRDIGDLKDKLLRDPGQASIAAAAAFPTSSETLAPRSHS